MSAPADRAGRHESFLAYRGFRYLKLAGVAALAALVAYAVHAPPGAPNGGTWLGYMLGGISAALMLLLAWFGVQKRRYGAGRTPLKAWLSAHVPLGLALLVTATLHAGFQLGWNIHSLAWLLMAASVASGLFGVVCYLRYPILLAASRHGMTTADMLAQIGELDRECRALGLPLGDDVNAALVRAGAETRVGGSLRRLLAGRDADCPTRAARLLVEGLRPAAAEADRVRRLHAQLMRKESLLEALRRHVRIAAVLRLWLVLHVPLSVGALAAVAAHVFVVFFYW